MLLSATIAPLLRKNHTMQECIEICKTAGLDAMDMPFYLDGWNEEETDTPQFLQQLTDFRTMAADSGMTFNQAHATFYGRKAYLANPETCTQNVIRTIKYAALLGAKKIVVHPLHHLPYKEPGNPEELFQINMAYYAMLQKYCEEYGIVIAVENMFQRAENSRVLRSACSTPDEFCRYLENLDSKWFTGCLDIGHAMLNDEPVSFIQKAGKYIGALHVHDNGGFCDDHQIPYSGIIRWDDVADALRNVGYAGDFTYEVTDFQENMPAELDLPAYTMLAQIGRSLMKKIEG